MLIFVVGGHITCISLETSWPAGRVSGWSEITGSLLTPQVPSAGVAVGSQRPLFSSAAARVLLFWTENFVSSFLL